jgi:hypothetical protein
MSALCPARILPFALVAAVGLSAAPARADDTSRWIAALPFGAGQFQNGDVRAVTTTNRVTFTAWAVLTAASVIEVQVNLVPRRAAPGHQRCPLVAATAAPIPGGGLVGVRAAF